MSTGLARLLCDAGRDVLCGADAVVPVPLHWSRRRERGFNQAADLARRTGLPVLDVLRRVRATSVQASLPAARRRANVRGAFDLSRQAWWTVREPSLQALARTSRMAATARLVEGRCLVIIDDVCTTGATLDACAHVLKAAGAREVRALTAARAVTRPPR